ncbi:MAG: acetyl-CoA synthetase [Hadesarchaea archaeon]|nr:MAG: acetyl-CoA synthetase [Hadesarchaea archaeon]
MTPEMKRVAEIIRSAKADGKLELLEIESKRLLEAWGVPVNRTELAREKSEAIRIAREVHYPLVMKIASPDIPQKSSVGGVRVGIGSEIELRQAFDEIIENTRSNRPSAKLLGVTVQEYLPPAREVIVRAERNPSFGAVVCLSMEKFWGGRLDDSSFRLAPLTLDDAHEMISEVRGYPILVGGRDTPSSDMDALADVICKIGQLVHEFLEISKVELDPVFVFDAGRGAVVADARVTLEVK